MVKRNVKPPKKKAVRLKNALDSASLSSCLQSSGPDVLAQLLHDLRIHLYYWTGDPTEARILQLRESFPLLDQFIDFDVILDRLRHLDDFERGMFGLSLQKFFPELQKVLEATDGIFSALPAGVEKAEHWLRPLARNASANSDVEAAVYFASRGQREIIDVVDLRNRWHSEICHDIEYGAPVRKVPGPLLERARTKTLSLAEAASVVEFNGSLPRFFSFLDHEDDFIDATMFRAVEWFGISGFEPWLRSLVNDLSVGPQYGIDHAGASWWLFQWCRSDLALRMADRSGLEAWLWALINGPVQRDKPWILFNARGNEPATLIHIPTAAVIPFIWNRIQPDSIKSEVPDRASEILFQTQMRSGAWPTCGTDAEGSLMATCFAIHGLATYKPTGWQQAVRQAADWIETKQDDWGCWDIQGGPTVMITVLALDALQLANAGKHLTFTLAYPTDRASSSAVRAVAMSPVNGGGDESEPVYDFSSVDWYRPTMPPSTSVDASRARAEAKPDIAFIVATDIELLQILRVMKPICRQRRLWKIMHGCDTYYLGRFGSFQAVVALSAMGSQGAGGSTLCADATIRTWEPRIVILAGIAFAASRRKYLPGDVLVAEHIIPYESQRMGDETIFRNPVPPSSAILLDRFRHALDWHFARPDQSNCTRHIGPMLSGEKLVDNLEFRDSLLKQYPSAIGGEMEGAGLWGAASRARKEWIIVKGVCDWGDGKKHKEFQALAAAAAVSLCHHVFKDTRSLDGV